MGRRRVGPTVFAQVESEASYYFAGPEQLVMINFLVRDLDGMVARLRTAGADVDGEIEPWEGTGRCARVTDPEGDWIQLWEPHLKE